MILVLGDLILDEYWHGSTTRLSPEAPVPVIQIKEKSLRVGGAGNVALNLASMGSPVRLISQAAPDLNHTLLSPLDHQLIPCSVTPHKTRIFTNDQVICRIDSEQYQGVTAQQSWLTRETSICVLSDYNKGFLHECDRIINWCNSQGIRTIVDPKKSWDRYRGCWLLKANAAELSAELGREWCEDELGSICADLAHQHAISNLVITQGSRGLYVWNGFQGRTISADASSVKDVTGAGDVITAALAHYTSNGLDLFSAAAQANTLAGISVSHQGCYVITAADMSRAEGRTVFTNGCFDILHRGHIEYLQKSRALGTRLVVGLNSDRSVRELKGSERPINKQEDRRAMLLGLSCVDEVVIFDEPTPYELIKQIKPDIITKGGDYTVDQVVGNDLVNQVVIIPLVDGYSTTDILEKIHGEDR